MNKYILILLSLFFSISINSQEEEKYLDGAVPEVDGKIVFEKTIKPKASISDVDLYNLIAIWAKENYLTNMEDGLASRLLFENPEAKEFAYYGEEYLVFRKNYFILDRTKMSYQLIVKINQGECNVAVRGIKYDYEGDLMTPAEEMISDKVALNSKKKKLNNYYDKFRRNTIDYVDVLFSSIDIYLNGDKTEKTTPVSSLGAIDNLVKEQKVDTPSNVMSGYKSIIKDKIPAKLQKEWTLVSSGEGETTNVVTALWGGTGTLGDKSVAFSSLNSVNGSVKILEKEETYVISFYTEIYQDALAKFSSTKGDIANKIKESGLTPIQTPSGATTFAEAWMIIECKKGTAQPTPELSVVDVDDMNKDNYSQTYIGEILNVWVK